MIAHGTINTVVPSFCLKEKEIVNEKKAKVEKKEVEKKTKQKGRQMAEPG